MPSALKFDQLRRRLPEAIKKSLNRAIVSARVQLERDVAKAMQLKVGDVRARLTVREAPTADGTASIKASIVPVPAIKFGAKATKRGGVTAKLPGSPFRHAFIAAMKSGHRGVFQRTGKPRLPIREERGPAVSTIAMQHVDAARARAAESFQKNMQAEIKNAMR